jgi:putative aldouronate transport system substrate-binding protein
MEDNLMKEYETLEYPTAANNGDFPSQAITVTPMVSRSSFCISSKCQNVPAALRWIDYLFTNDGYLLKQYGTPGKHIKKTSETTYEFTTTPASPDAGPKWGLRGRNFLDDGAKITNEVVSPMYERRYAIDAWCDTTLKNNQQKFMPKTWKNKEEINNEKLYTKYWDQVSGEWWNFVRGEKDMNAWTTLVNEMNKKGINKYVAVLQKYYDRCNGK